MADYCRALEDIPVDRLELALDLAKKREKFMPTPATIREYADNIARAFPVGHPLRGRKPGERWTEAGMEYLWPVGGKPRKRSLTGSSDEWREIAL